MPYGLTDLNLNTILSMFSRNIKVQEVVLFGSRVMGNFHTGSDIDICLKGELLDGYADVLAFQKEYEELWLINKLDILVYHEITEPKLVEHIDKVGICLFKNNAC